VQFPPGYGLPGRPGSKAGRAGGRDTQARRRRFSCSALAIASYAQTVKLKFGARTGGGILMRANFDIKWFEIAAKHHRAAEEARNRAEAAKDASNEMALAFDDELQATMVVVAAAAFAIDALYVKLEELLDPSDRTPTTSSRVGRIIETFKIALDLGRRTQEWQRSIKQLFDVRDELVHFRGEDHPTEPHPTGKSHVSRESSFYTVEKATWALDLAYEVLTVAYTSPRAKHEALVAYTKNAAHVPAMFDEMRHGKK
jgi:hypothetical protein